MAKFAKKMELREDLMNFSRLVGDARPNYLTKLCASAQGGERGGVISNIMSLVS